MSCRMDRTTIENIQSKCDDCFVLNPHVEQAAIRMSILRHRSNREIDNNLNCPTQMEWISLFLSPFCGQSVCATPLVSVLSASY